MIALLAACGRPDPAPPPPATGAPETASPPPSGDTGTPEALRPSVTGVLPGPVDLPFRPRWPQFADCGPMTFAARTGDRQGDKGTALAGTADGVIQGGNFTLTATFGAGAAAASLTSLAAPYGNGFVARYRHDGELLWVRQAASTGLAAVREVAVDPADGRVAVGGYYSRASVTLDGGGRSVTLEDATTEEFVALYDADGTVQWAVRLGGSSLPDEVTGLAFGGEGELYVGGTTAEPTLQVSGANGALAVPIDPAPGFTAGFLVRLDRDGTPRWGRSLTGSRRVDLVGVGKRSAGGVTVAGDSLAELVVTAGRGGLQRLELPTGGVFTTDWEPNGDLASVRAAIDGSSGLQAYASGDGSWLFGTFREGAVWAPGRPGATVGQDWHASLGRLNGDGSLASLTEVLGQPLFNTVTAAGLADRNGTLAMAGFQSGVVTWGAGTPREAVVDAGTMTDGTSPWEPLLVTYTPDGVFDCFWHLDSDVKYGMSSAVAWDGLGGLWVTGWFTERLVLNEGMATEVTFETIPEDPTDPEGHHEPDVFLARFAPP